MKGLFSFAPVAPGQRNVKTSPELVAVTTRGGITVSAEISKALDLKAGDYLAFINNIDAVDRAILAKEEAYTAWAEQKGLDVDDPATGLAFHAENDAWGIMKGYPTYTKDGQPEMVAVRVDRKAAVAASYDEILAEAQKATDNAELQEALAAAEGDVEATSEVLIRFFADLVEIPTEQNYFGSKLASPSGMAGATKLSCADANVWAQLKAGLTEAESKKISRTFAIDLTAMDTLTVNDGAKDIVVRYIPFDAHEYSDKETARTKAE
jgi:bifunctional DNA-binding transcriptional regulator/antitoxin component of YhaV-PrlF toxin-antitoxin module